MEMEKINQSLAQLEENLKSLDSARKQVEIVTNGSNELTKTTLLLIQEVNDFAMQIGDNTTAIIINFENKLSDFETRINHTASLGQETIVDEVAKFGIRTSEIKTTVENSINEIKSLSIEIIQKQEISNSETLNSVSKLVEFEIVTAINKLEAEVVKLIDADFTSLFDNLQIVLINQTREDLALELSKIDEKSTTLQAKIENLNAEIERLENIDLERHSVTLQRTLSEIFGAINPINGTLTSIVQTLTGIVQTLGNIQTVIDANHKETKQLLNSFSEATEKHFVDQDRKATRNVELLVSNMKSLSEQNELLKKEAKTNRTIQIVGFLVIISTLIYLIVK